MCGALAKFASKKIRDGALVHTDVPRIARDGNGGFQGAHQSVNLAVGNSILYASRKTQKYSEIIYS